MTTSDTGYSIGSSKTGPDYCGCISRTDAARGLRGEPDDGCRPGDEYCRSMKPKLEIYCRKDTAGDGKEHWAGRFRQPTFAEQIAALQNGTFPRRSALQISPGTPKLLQEMGLRDHPVLCGPKHVMNALALYSDLDHQHEIPLHVIRKLPGYLRYPVMVFDSENRRDSIVIVTEGMDVFRQPVIAAMHVEGCGSFLGEMSWANYITGIYGKRRLGLREMVRRAVYDDRMLYVDSAKTARLFKKIHLPVPEELGWTESDAVDHVSRNALYAQNTRMHLVRYLDQLREDELFYRAVADEAEYGVA